MIEMDRKVENLLHLLDEIRKSNNFQLAKDFANIPLHLDQLATLKQEISKKDKEWLHNVVESLRLFCLSAYLNIGVVNTNMRKDFTRLIVKDNIKPTADGLIHILEMIWKMHGNTIYKTQLNADRALQVEQSRAQRNEQSANATTNLQHPETVYDALDEMSKNNNPNALKELFNTISANPLYDNGLAKFLKRIEEKDKIWLQSVIEKLRFLCPAMYGMMNNSRKTQEVKKSFTTLIVKPTDHTIGVLEKLLLFIWKMSEHEIVPNNNDVSLQWKADKQRAYNNIARNRFRTRRVSFPNESKENLLKRTREIVHLDSISSENPPVPQRSSIHRIPESTNLYMERTFAPEVSNLDKRLINASKRAGKNINLRPHEHNVANSHTLKQRNNFNTSTIMGNEYVPQIATIHTVKGGRKTRCKRKTLRRQK